MSQLSSTIIGPAIKTARERHGPRGMTLEELSALARVDVASLSKIENGQRAPSAGALFRLARVLGLDLNGLAWRYSVADRKAQEKRRANGAAPDLSCPDSPHEPPALSTPGEEP